MINNNDSLVEASCSLTIRRNKLRIWHRDRDYSVKFTHGWRYLCALLESPGLPFRPWQLERPECEFEDRQGPFTHLDAMQNADLSYCDLLPPLPLADARTIQEIKQRLNHLLEAIALARDFCDLGQMEKLLTEKEDLQDYLMQVYSPRGRIRDFPSEQQKQQQRVNKYIRRAVKQLEALDPYLARYLASHLKLGSWLQYSPGELEITVQRY